MKFLLYILFSAFIISMITSCKKDTAIISEQTVSDNNIYTTSLSIQQNYKVLGNSLISSGRIAQGIFVYATPYSTYYTYLTNIDSLYLNNILINKKNWYWQPYYYYWDTITQNSGPPFKWKIKGSSQFPSFTENISDSVPRFSKHSLLPDSILLNGSTTIQLEGFNANQLSITLNDGIHSGMWGYNTSPTTSLVSINTPTFLSITNNATLSIRYSNEFSKYVEGKKIDYLISCVYDKTVRIVP